MLSSRSIFRSAALCRSRENLGTSHSVSEAYRLDKNFRLAAPFCLGASDAA
jgi:hypothetical protein